MKSLLFATGLALASAHGISTWTQNAAAAAAAFQTPDACSGCDFNMALGTMQSGQTKLLRTPIPGTTPTVYATVGVKVVVDPQVGSYGTDCASFPDGRCPNGSCSMKATLSFDLVGSTVPSEFDGLELQFKSGTSPVGSSIPIGSIDNPTGEPEYDATLTHLCSNDEDSDRNGHTIDVEIANAPPGTTWVGGASPIGTMSFDCSDCEGPSSGD